MAHDRLPDDPLYSASTPYPSYDYKYPDPRQYQAPPPPPNLVPPYQPAERARSRASSNARSPSEPFRPQPVYDAVSDAFDHSAAANQVPDEIIRQITEQVRTQVIHSLKTEGYAAPPPASAPPQSQYAFQPPPTTAAAPKQQSPPTNSTPVANPPPRRSPPLRRRSSESLDHPRRRPSPVRNASSGSSPLDAPAQDPLFNMSGDTKKEDLTSRYGDRSEADLPRRPAAASRKTDEEETTLEKIWQPLYGSNGEPTPRLGQFLRGLALHIIDDYEPKRSLVITPAKLKKFYEDVKLQEETYPWSSIFRLNNASIAKIYRDLKLSHFYVQERISDAPVVPALTPEGFQRWMTLLIRAHPQAEFERLAQAVRDMPINNADNPKERFPKELSRRLLPKYDDLQTRQYTGAALSADGQISLPKHTSFPPPPPPGNSSQTSNSFDDRMRDRATDRERAPYASQPTARDSAIDSDDDIDHRPSVQIERERKPYTAKAGAGKIYENENTSSSSTRTLKPETSLPGKHRPSSAFIERDLDHHSDSSRTSDYTAATGSASNVRRSRTYSKSARRPRSPTGLANPYVKSDSSVGEVPATFYTSNIYDGRDERYREDDRYRSERDRDLERGERDRDRDRDRGDRGERERDRERDREREREREKERERESREREEYLRRAEEDERRFARYDGEPLSRRSTVESGYPANYQYPSVSGNGEPRRYG